MLNISLVTFAFLLLNQKHSFNLLKLSPELLGRLIVYDVIVFIIGISMYLTSRVGTRYYDRRENESMRSTDNWWTISISSIVKRVETRKLRDNLINILADNELKSFANVGDTIKFSKQNKLSMMGNVEEINDKFIRISLPVKM